MKKVIIVLAFVLSLTTSASAYTEIKHEAFKQSVAKGLSVVEFYSPNCPHCKKMEGVIAKFEKENDHKKFFRINILDEVVDNKPSEWIQSTGVTSWPYFILYKDGVEIYRFKGEMAYEKFERFASLTDKPTQDQLIDFRTEELKAEYDFLGQRGQQISEELTKINTRMQQIPAAVEELLKMKSTVALSADCPSGNCGS